MSLDESPCEDHHYRSSFLSNSNFEESDFASVVSSNLVKNTQSHVFIQYIDFEGNLCNVNHTIPIDISMKPKIVEHDIGQTCSASKIKIYTSLLKEL